TGSARASACGLITVQLRIFMIIEYVVPSTEYRANKPRVSDNPTPVTQILRPSTWRLVLGTLLLVTVVASAQGNPTSKPAADTDISGMYTFLREGEFVEVDVEPDGRVTGFISRYGDGDS